PTGQPSALLSRFYAKPPNLQQHAWLTVEDKIYCQLRTVIISAGCPLCNSERGNSIYQLEY
ncbi:hypothetical protein V1951_20340, partial [Yersinia sp. 2544 StPb PI]|uniref:hypothetical protein n=1 Tax=Yersinia sp. 2544 StPb PI TaxID=3117409 RepID=UPI003B283475